MINGDRFLPSRLAFGAIALAICVLIGSAVAHAAAISGQLWLDRPAVAAYPTFDDIPGLGAPDTMFAVAAIDFDSTVNGFAIEEFLNNPTFSNPSVVAGRDLYSIVILFTGTVALQAGDNIFLFSHDDGAQLFIEGIGLVIDEPGPGPAVDSVFSMVAPTAGNYEFKLLYGQCCAPPGKLVWTSDIPVGIPEPASLVLLGAALTGLGMAVTRRRPG
jgi:hypothetical protein